MYKNILIVKLSAIGDVIHALPAVHALKQCYPKAHITWVVEPIAAELLRGNPHIDELLIFEKKRCKTLAGLMEYLPGFIRRLRQKKYDVALDLQGLFKSAAIAFLSGAQQRLVYENAREGSAVLGQRIVGPHATGHIIERYLDVVRALGCTVSGVQADIYLTPEEQKEVQELLQQQGIQPGDSFIAFSMGANWPNKIWPPAKVATVIERLTHDGRRSLLVGGPGDQPLAETVFSGVTTRPASLVGATTLRQLAGVIKKAAVFVGGDTGPMHLAAALGRPTVALMGPTDPPRNGPYGAKNKAVTIQRECKECWKRACPKGLDCLDDIGTDEVYTAIRSLLA